MGDVRAEGRAKTGERLYGLLDDSHKAMVDAFMLFLYDQQKEKAERIKQTDSNKNRVDFTTESINKWLEANGQIEMLTGETGIEAMRELTKNDVW